MTEDEAKALAKRMLTVDEGKSRRIYPDSRGVLTIGIGHNCVGNDLSDRAIDLIFEDDLLQAAVGICKVFSPELLESIGTNRKLALLNLMFNLGAGRFGKFKRMIAAVNEQRWEDAAAELFDSAWAYQVDDGPGGKPGRADRVAAMLENDKFPY